jgi:hypothetical protein
MAVQRRADGTTRGGNEPPDEVQDTPKQNAGYNAAVRGERRAEVAGEKDAAGDGRKAERTEAEQEELRRLGMPGTRYRSAAR